MNSKTLTPDIELVTKAVKESFPNRPAFIVGSYCLNYPSINDLDILILYDNPIKINDWKQSLDSFKKIIGKKQRQKYSIIPNFADDNKNLKKEFPYINIYNPKDSKLIDSNKLTQSQLETLQLNLYKTRNKKKNFYKKGLL